MILINWVNDDRADIFIDGEPVITANYDDHGRQGMADIIAAVIKVGDHYGATIVTDGVPGA